MKLLFAYFDFTNQKDGISNYHGLGQCSLNYSTTHDFTVSRSDEDTSAMRSSFYSLSCKEKPKQEQLPKDFWGDRIYNMTAIVGGNGAGKSSLLHSLIKALVKGLDPGAPFLLVMQKTINKTKEPDFKDILIYCGGGIQKDAALHVQQEGLLSKPQICKNYPSMLKKVKIMLLDNTLSASSIELDSLYSRKIPVEKGSAERGISPKPFNEWQKQLYNKSLFSSIRYSNEKSISEQPLYARTTADDLPVHFRYETYQETRFLFDEHQQTMLQALADADYSVPRPRYVYVKALDVTDLYEAASQRNAVRDGQNSELPTVCASLSLKGFWGKLIADALYILYSAAYEFRFLRDVSHYYSEVELNSIYQKSITNSNMFSIADSITLGIETLMERILQEMQLDFSKKNNKGLTEKGTDAEAANTINTVKNLASNCRDFINFLSDEEETLVRVFLKVNVQSTESDSLGIDQYERKIDIRAAIANSVNQNCIIGFLERYQKISWGTYFMLFSSGLSSGEKNLLRMLTQFRHVLADDFISNKREQNTQHGLINCFKDNNKQENVNCVCDTLFLVLDEADLTYHPEWQRQFVSLLTAVLPAMFSAHYESEKGPGCKDIQVIIATHSPLMLSDIPVQSCIFLRNEDESENSAEEGKWKRGLVVADNHSLIQQTFASNLHDLLNNAFFLSCTIGEFARKKIIDISGDLKKLAQEPMNMERREKCQPYIQVIELIGDPIIRNKLRGLYDRCFPSQKEVNAAFEGISSLSEHREKFSDAEREQLIQRLEQVATMLRMEVKGDTR